VTNAPKHAPEPWMRGGEARPHYVYTSEPNGSFAVANFASPSNAARAVACVNACAGIEDPAAALAEVRAELLNLWNTEGQVLTRRMRGAYADDGYCTMLRARVTRLHTLLTMLGAKP
jgi:hypothetical protein